VIQSALNSLTAGRVWKERVALRGTFILDNRIQLSSYTILDMTEAYIKLKDNAQLPLVEWRPGQPEEYRLAPLIYATDETDIEILGGILDGNRLNQNQVDKWGTPRHVAIGLRCCENVRCCGVRVKSFASGGIWCKFYEGYAGDITGVKIVENCVVEDCGYEPIAMTDNKYCIVRNCYVKDSFVPGGDTWNHNITFERSKHCIAVGNVLRNLPSGTTGTNVAAIKVDGWDVSVIGNTIDWITECDGTCRGIFAWQGSANPDRVGRVVIQGNTIKMNGGLGIYFEAESGYEIGSIVVTGNSVYLARHGIGLNYTKYCVVSKNILSGCSTSGVKLNRVYNSLFLGNVVLGNKWYGIYINNIGESLIMNNYIRNNAHCGIQIYGSDIHIEGNILRNNGNYGIDVASGSSNIRIIRNDLYNAATTIISDAGTNTVIKQNRGYITENSGTATFSGDGTTTQFSIAHGLVSAPTKVQVTPMTADAAADFYVTADNTNIYINYKSAPPSGTDNLKFSWYAEV